MVRISDRDKPLWQLYVNFFLKYTINKNALDIYNCWIIQPVGAKMRRTMVGFKTGLNIYARFMSTSSSKSLAIVYLLIKIFDSVNSTIWFLLYLVDPFSSSNTFMRMNTSLQVNQEKNKKRVSMCHYTRGHQIPLRINR